MTAAGLSSRPARRLAKPLMQLWLALAWIGAAAPAAAQTSTTGAVQGTVIGEGSGAQEGESRPLVGATVVATSPALLAPQSEDTDASGSYFLSSLPPGLYEVTVYYADAIWTRKNVLVQVGKVARVNITVTLTGGLGETIVIEGSAPLIDQGSTKTGVTIDRDYAQRIPTGRTYQEVLDAAATSGGDAFGTSFSGGTSPENAYVIDGLNVTDPIYGGATSLFQGASTTTNLPNEFVQEVEVITGGYGARHGRATGSVINVVTRSGGNTLSGSLFTYFTPGALSPAARAIAREDSAIARADDLVYDASTGAELGGPIVRDRLWFHVGLSPTFATTDVHRIINRFYDQDGDGQADVDPATGFLETREVGRTTSGTRRTSYMFTGKLSFALGPAHQGNVSFHGSPGAQETFRRVTGREDANRLTVDDGALDVSARWTSKLAGNKTQIDAVVGWHRSMFDEQPARGGLGPQVAMFDQDALARFAAFEPGGAIPEVCMADAGKDPDTDFLVCPVTDYNAGGLGFYETLTGDRLAGSLVLTQRVRAGGRHQIEAGLDTEYNVFDRHSRYTGGQRYSFSPYDFQDVAVRGFYRYTEQSDIDCGGVPCALSPDGVRIENASRQLAWFLQDSWSPLPSLTLDAGVRWELQTLYTAESLAGTPSRTTGEIIDEEAFTLDHLWAPRLSVIYDWTGQGRSRLYAHVGRYYQSIPLYVGSQAFGGEITGTRYHDIAQCSDPYRPEQAGCTGTPYDQDFFGGDEQFVAPKLRGQYLDQVIVGAEYQVLEDVKVGASYTRRDLGRIIEDVSADRGGTTIIANPGEAVDADAIQALRDEAARLRAAGEDARAEVLESKAAHYAIIGVFDRPARIYQALQLSASKRFATDLMLRAAYTYSRTEGNVVGLVNPENGINGLAPNFSSLYDLPELMANQYGLLPQDTPHLFKLDGYYMRAFAGIGHFVLGSSVRVRSGVPYSYRGSHPEAGGDATVILPRGSAGRVGAAASFDVKLTYGRALGRGMTLEAFVDVFNLFNSQAALDVDESYTDDDVHPIVGGDANDLRHLKALDRAASERDTARVARAKPNFGNTTAAQAPLSMRFGLRLSF